MYLLIIVNIAAFFTLLQAVLYNIVNEYISAVQINFVIAIIGLFLAGGIVPQIFLPNIVDVVEWVFPISHIRSLISYGLISSDLAIYHNITIVLVNIIFVAILFKLMKRRMENI